MNEAPRDARNTSWVDHSDSDQTGFTYGRSRLVVQLWRCVDIFLFRHTPLLLFGWRRFVLRLFGARVAHGVKIWPHVRVHFPWRLEIGEHSGVGEDAWLYNVDRISIGSHCVISQKTVLCTASHDPSHPRFRAVTAPIVVEDGAWIALDCFVGPGVTIGANTVVGARSTVMKSLPAGKICFGHPCRVHKDRVIQNGESESSASADEA